MIILPSINLGIADNSRSSTQCIALSPYALNDYCYLKVIILDSNCCNSIWNQTCEDLYLNCKNTPPPPPPPPPPPSPIINVEPRLVHFMNYGYTEGEDSLSFGDHPIFTISGENLNNNITILPGINYKVHLGEDTTYAGDYDNYMPNPGITLNPDIAGKIEAIITVGFFPTDPISQNEIIYVSSSDFSTIEVEVDGKARALTDNADLLLQARDGQITLYWASSGDGDMVIVLAKLGTSPITDDIPMNDLESFVASSVYGEGDQIGLSYLVYKEAQTNSSLYPLEIFTVTNLMNQQNYTFKVFIVKNYRGLSNGSSATAAPFPTLLTAGNVIAQWIFNSDQNQLVYGTTDVTYGQGSLILIGATTSASYNAGSPSDPLGIAGAQTGGNNSSLIYTGRNTAIVNKSSGIQIAVSTIGKNNIIIYWDNRHSSAGPKHLRAQYTLNITAPSPVWVDYTAETDGSNIANNGLYETQIQDVWYIQRKADLSSVAGVSNNANFGFRLVASYAPGKSGYEKANNSTVTPLSYFGGNFRTDMLTVVGTLI